jgi:hypothetical protein
MKVKKITVRVTVEVLSIDSVYIQLIDVANQIRQEHISGQMCSDDGDQATWGTDYGKEHEI